MPATTRPPLTDEALRSAVLDELLAPPEQRSGRLQFTMRDGDTTVTGVADHDRRRYLSRMEIDRPDTRASFDVAVIDGQRYEKLLRLEQAGHRTPDFEPRSSSPERWSPGQSGVPYLRVPYVGEPHLSDIRRLGAGLDDAARRGRWRRC